MSKEEWQLLKLKKEKEKEKEKELITVHTHYKLIRKHENVSSTQM